MIYFIHKHHKVRGNWAMTATLGGNVSAVSANDAVNAAGLGELIARLSERAAYATGEEYAEIRTLVTALKNLLSAPQ
jgi:hypothetical protein